MNPQEHRSQVLIKARCEIIDDWVKCLPEQLALRQETLEKFPRQRC